LHPKYALVPPVETFTHTITATVTREFLNINAGLRDGNMATNISKTEDKTEINYMNKNEIRVGLISILDLSVFEHFWGIRKFVKKKAIISFVMSVCTSVCPHGTTRLPMDGFSLNVIAENFSNISREN